MINTVPLPPAEPMAVSQNTASSRDRLEELALDLARILTLANRPNNNDPLPARLKRLGIFLQSAYRYFNESSQKDTNVSHAAEWMLDNFYIVEQAIRQTSENLPPVFYQRLPKANVDGGEMARIHILAFMLTKAGDSHLDVDQIKSLSRLFKPLLFSRSGKSGRWRRC